MNVNLILENLLLLKKLPFVALEKLSIAITLPKGLFICCCFSFGCSLCVWMCFLNSFIESKNHVNVSVHKIKLLWSISLWAKWQKDDIKRAKGLDIKVGSHYEKAPEACIEELCDAVRTNITSGSCDQQHPRLFGHFDGIFFQSHRNNLWGEGSECESGDSSWYDFVVGNHIHLLLPTGFPGLISTYPIYPTATKLRHCYVMYFGIVRSLVCHTFWGSRNSSL